MPYIAIKSWPGRDKEQQMKIGKAVIKAFAETAEIPVEAFSLSYEDVPQDKWDQEVTQGDHVRLGDQVIIPAGPKDWK